MNATGHPGGPAKDAPPPPATGELAVVNVYDADRPWPANTTITALRVMQIFPKINGTEMNRPNISRVSESTARSVLGTVPVERDGSVFLTVPADVPIYLQALDKDGRAVGTMPQPAAIGPETRTFWQRAHLLSAAGPTGAGPPLRGLSHQGTGEEPENPLLQY